MTYDQSDERIRAIATEDFLQKLVEIARVGGWSISSDYTEVQNFVENVFAVCGKDVPDLTPIELED